MGIRIIQSSKATSLLAIYIYEVKVFPLKPKKICDGLLLLVFMITTWLNFAL